MKDKDKAPALKVEVGFSEFMERLLRVKKEEIRRPGESRPGKGERNGQTNENQPGKSER